jgi:hypothetical protein
VTWYRSWGSFDLGTSTVQAVLATLPIGVTLERVIFGWTCEAMGYTQDAPGVPGVFLASYVATLRSGYTASYPANGQPLEDVSPPLERVIYREFRRMLPYPLGAPPGLTSCLWVDDVGTQQRETFGQVVSNPPSGQTLDVRLGIQPTVGFPDSWAPTVRWWANILWS